MQSISTRPANPIITYRVTHRAASQKYVNGRDGVDAGGIDAGGVNAGGVEACGVEAGGVDAGGVDAGGVDAGALFGVYVYIMPPSIAQEDCVDVESSRFLLSCGFRWKYSALTNGANTPLRNLCCDGGEGISGVRESVICAKSTSKLSLNLGMEMLLVATNFMPPRAGGVEGVVLFSCPRWQS